jgi:replicative DNA helicase
MDNLEELDDILVTEEEQEFSLINEDDWDNQNPTRHLEKIETKVSTNPWLMTNDDMDCLIDKSCIPTATTEAEEEMLGRINEFKKKVLHKDGIGFKLPWSQLEHATEGLQSGLYLLGGYSNHGKSALLTAIEVGLCECNEDVYVVSFSLDDSFKDKFARIAAVMNSTSINFIKNPVRYGVNPDDIDNDVWGIKWQNSVTRATQLLNKLCIIDSDFGSDIDLIEEKIKQILKDLQKQEDLTGKKRRLVVTIDNYHDLSCTDKSAQEENAKWTKISQVVSGWSQRFDIPILCTAEIKKLNGNRRPTKEDIRSAGKQIYEANMIIMVYNDISQRGDAATVSYTFQGETEKRPILEVNVVKNKIGSYKSRMFFYFRPEYCKLTICSDDASRKFASKIN